MGVGYASLSKIMKWLVERILYVLDFGLFAYLLIGEG
jgi:hypothetical protein